MAISRGNSLSIAEGYGDVSTSFDAGSGSNRLLLVFLRTQGTSDLITTITYNGVALTRIAWNNFGVSQAGAYVYALVAPASGANTLVVDVNNVYQLRQGWAVAYSGVNQVNPSNISQESDNTDPFSFGITVGTANSWVVNYINDGNYGSGSMNWSSGITRINYSSGNALGDTNAGVSAGSFTCGGLVGSGETVYSALVEIAEASGGSPATVIPPQIIIFN